MQRQISFRLPATALAVVCLWGAFAPSAIAPAQAAGYHIARYTDDRGPYGLPAVDTIAQTYTYPVAKMYPGSTWYTPYYPSRNTQYYSGGFGGTTLSNSRNTTGAYRAVNY
jgi:hypothetical protein